MSEKMAVHEKIHELIGDTPLLKIDQNIHGLQHIELYAKLEYLNPFGSVKDRIAKGMLSELPHNGKTILEASSGNTAKALAALCGTQNTPFLTVTNRIKIDEIRMMLQVLGAEIRELPGLSDCPDPNDPNDYTTIATRIATAEPERYHYTDQYFNKKNPESHESTALELDRDLGKIDYFIGFLGTCGTTIGAGRKLKDLHNTQVIGIVASPGHHVPGGRNLDELWEVGFFRKDFYDIMVDGTTQEAIQAMLTLNRRCGMLCGPTTGLTYHCAIKSLSAIDQPNEDGTKKKAVFIACDRIEPYMHYIRRYAPELFSAGTITRPTVDGQKPEVVHGAPVMQANDFDQTGKTLIIDIRSNFAYRTGHIENAINIQSETLANIVEEGPAFPQQSILIVCTNGTVSRKFASFLASQGYQASSLQGGMLSWKEQQRPLVREMHDKPDRC
jgi:cysteine synthase B